MRPDDLHVLLIGIDAYDGRGASLKGCVNDIDAVQGILLDRLGVPRGRVTRLAAPRYGAVHDTRIASEIPTLDAIVGELGRLAGAQVAPHERVFIYFAGHGTQVVMQDEEGRLFAREGLLPKDRVNGPETRVLADWQLNAMLARIGAGCHSVTVVLDCCCSAGATRAPGTGTTRFWPTVGVQRIPSGQDAMAGALRGLAEGVVASAGNCQVVAACRADEKAQEGDVGGRGATMGHLTRSLCECLLAVGVGELAVLRWGRIWRQVEAAVIARNSTQRPWLSSGFGRAVFGGDSDERGDAGFAIVQRGDDYELDVGTMAGVTEGARIGVYGPDPNTFPRLDGPEDRAARLGELLIRSATRAGSTAVPVGLMTIPDGARGRLVAPGVDARLAIAFEPSVDERVAAALRRSPFVQIVDDVCVADLELHRRAEGWILADDIFGFGTDCPSFPTVPPDRLDLLREVVEHYYRYRGPLRLASACRDMPTMLGISLLDCAHRKIGPLQAQMTALPEIAGNARVRYEVTAGHEICIAVHNQSYRGLHVTLVDAAASGRVILLGSAQIPARARERFWSTDVLGTPFVVTLEPGQPAGVERIVAIGTTVSGVDLNHLRQDACFADLFQTDRARQPPTPDFASRKPPVELYTSATVDLWVRGPGTHNPSEYA